MYSCRAFSQRTCLNYSLLTHPHCPLPAPGISSPVSPYTIMLKPIERITMFKIPKKEDRERALNQYKTLRKTAVKDGKPYILTCEAGHAGQEPRAQGWTLAVKTTFASKDDMDYYDDECEAHKALKAVVSGMRTDVMTVWFESALNE